MQVANSPHAAAKPTVRFPAHGPPPGFDLPAKACMLACMLPAFSMSYVALVSMLSFRPGFNMRVRQVRRIGAVCARPRRLVSANHEPPEPAEEVPEELPEEKLGISFNSCGPQNQPPTTRKLPMKAMAGARMRLRIPLIDFEVPLLCLGHAVVKPW